MAWSKVVWLCGCLFASISVAGQSNRYIVNLTDKNNSPFSVQAPQQFLSAKSIARRQKQQIAVTLDDLPVNPEYLSQLAATGCKIRYTSRWRNAVLVEATETQLTAIEALPIVKSTEFVGPPKAASGGRARSFKDRMDSNIAPATLGQLSMLGIDEMQAAGYRGEGITIAVFDSGFLGVNTGAAFSSMFTEGRLQMQFDFVGYSADVFQYDGHGTEVLSTMAANSTGAFTGGAFQANYQLYVTEDVKSEFRVEEYNALFAAEKADSAGADIINISLGYYSFDDEVMDYNPAQLDGKTSVISWTATEAQLRGMLVVCSAGNEGNLPWKLVAPPGDAIDVLAVGAVSSQGTRMSFSSVGPSADGRVKPDVVALGSGVSVVKPNGAVSTSSGTSVASPLVASLAAGIWQAFPELTASELAHAMRMSADRASMPDNSRGYGVPHYQAVVNFIRAQESTDFISAYPNPTESISNILLQELESSQVEVAVYDLAGRMVFSSVILLNWQINPFQLDMSAWPAGLYLVKVQNGSSVQTLRLVKR
ncbi:MAG: S8/S53 family peptidase [Cyclobacteriaceae bacterium]